MAQKRLTIQWRNVFVVITLVILIRIFGFGVYQTLTGSMETTMLGGENFFVDKLTTSFTSIKRGEIISFNDPAYHYSDAMILNFWQRYFWGPSNWAKRVIGLPEEHIQGKIEDGHSVVYINGEKLDEPYINKYPLIAGLTEMPNLQSTKIFGNARVMYFSYDPNKEWEDQPFYATAISKSQLIENLPLAVRSLLPREYPVLQSGVPSEEVSDVFDIVLGKNEYWVMGDNRLGSLDSRSFGKIDGNLIRGRITFCILSVDSLNGWFITDLVQHPIEFFTKIVRWNRCMRFVS